MRTRLIAVLSMLTISIAVFAHPPQEASKLTPTKSTAELKKARLALDAYKLRISKEGSFSCCARSNAVFPEQKPTALLMSVVQAPLWPR